MVVVLISRAAAMPRLMARAVRRPGDLVADDVEVETLRKYQQCLGEFGQWLGLRSLGNLDSWCQLPDATACGLACRFVQACFTSKLWGRTECGYFPLVLNVTYSKGWLWDNLLAQWMC